MIHDTLSSAAVYQSLGPRFQAALAWLQSIDPTQLPLGKGEIAGSELTYTVFRDHLKAPADCKWEAHRRYADIQFLAQGHERMDWQPLAACRLGDYNPDKDFLAVSADAGHEIEVGPGQFAIFFPHDAHRPNLATGRIEAVTKIVVKVLVEA